MKDIYKRITEAERMGFGVALCTIVNTHGSSPRKIGSKMLVYSDGAIYGTIGGGELERSVIGNALSTISTRKPKLYRHDLLHQHNMCCGGTMDIYIEPIMKKSKLYIFGAGHTGQALTKYASNLNFEIVLIDERNEYINQCAIEDVNKLNISYQSALKLLPFDENTFICIMTHSHPMDREILAFCLKKVFAYLGMIGSRRKVEMTKKMFIQGLNIPEDKVEEVDMPMGIDIGAEGPDEIALSILAKIVGVKNNVAQWKKELHS